MIILHFYILLLFLLIPLPIFHTHLSILPVSCSFPICILWTPFCIAGRFARYTFGQVLKSGEAYIIHPLCVAIILAELELDKETIVAGILHDVVEDTVMTDEEIAEEFSHLLTLAISSSYKVSGLTNSLVGLI